MGVIEHASMDCPRIAGLVGLLLLSPCLTNQALAQNAANGQALYHNDCQTCHSPNPASSPAPYNLIMTAANNPAQITYAAGAFPAEMGFIPLILSQSDIADIAAYLGVIAQTSGTSTPVVEFYNAAQDHYFITASPAEIADLDNGIHAGWQRTGFGFNAFVAQSSGTSPVCRFYIPPAYGDSHFYSASTAECAQTLAKFPYFDYESPSVFYIALPDTTTGACPAATIPVYRVWDNRADSNHRYTTSLTIRIRMQAIGWIAEGYGPDQVIMCAPQ